MKGKRITPLRAIRFKYLDCCCGSSYEVKMCTCENCSLYPFREGRNPNITVTDERKKILIENLPKR